MIIAPPQALSDERRSRSRLFFFGAGLTFLAAFLLIVIILLAVAAYFYISPQKLYHHTWEVTQNYVLDPASLKDWDQWKHKFDDQIKSDEDAIRYANQMLASIGDRYTRLISPEEVARDREHTEGNFTGIGMVLGVKVDQNGQPAKGADGKPLPETDKAGNPLVKRVLDGSPARTSGLKAGDAITTIDGQATAGLSLEQLVQRVRGPEGQAVTLGILRDGQDFEVVVVRARVNLPAVTTKMLPNDIGYLRLEDFEQWDATDEVKAGLAALKDAEALIIDLRANPGGLLLNAVNISSLFLEDGTVVAIRSRIPGGGHENSIVSLSRYNLHIETTSTDSQRVEKERGPREPDLSAGRPLIILVDSNSASAAELFVGALKDHGRAIIVGTKTFGKGVGQAILLMPNGTRLRITTLRYYTPGGTSPGSGGGGGIEPDVTVEANPDLQFGSENDNQLTAAVEILSRMLGAASPSRP